MSEHKRLRGEAAHHDLESLLRWLGAAGVKLQTREEVDRQAEELIAARGRPEVQEYGPRCVVLAWEDGSVYGRTCAPHIDLWRNSSGEVAEALKGEDFAPCELEDTPFNGIPVHSFVVEVESEPVVKAARTELDSEAMQAMLEVVEMKRRERGGA